jgi:hypothetical protein
MHGEASSLREPAWGSNHLLSRKDHTLLAARHGRSEPPGRREPVPPGHPGGDGALLAVNLGEDADRTGAIYGQLAGAYYGEAGIPASWRAKLALHDRIVSLADRLWERSGLGG